MAGASGLYEIKLTIGQKNTNQIQQLTFIRCPQVKDASFAMCKVNLTPLQIKALQTRASGKGFQKCTVRIYEVDRITKKRKNPIFQKKYLIITCSPDNKNNVDIKEVQQSAMLVLAHPVLYEMSTQNKYNFKHENMTVLDAIKKYEEKIKKQEFYGNVFYVNRIGKDTKLNDFKYEEQLIKSPNDLHVPRLLNGMYKCYDSYSLFFFDCFYLNKQSKKSITMHHLNFFDSKDFKKKDITKYDDINKFAIPGQELPFIDVNRDHTFFSSPNITFITSNNQFIHAKTTGGASRSYSSTAKDVSTVKGRELSVTEPESEITVKTKRGTQTLTVEVPETDTKHALERVSTARDMNIETLKQYTFQNCIPDFPNFGEIYNLEPDNKSEYLYTPIAIANTFVKESASEPYCIHFSKANFIKYQSKTIQA